MWRSSEHSRGADAVPEQYLNHGPSVPVGALQSGVFHDGVTGSGMRTPAPPSRDVLGDDLRVNSSGFEFGGDLSSVLHRAIPSESGPHSRPPPAIEKEDDEQRSNAKCG